MTECVDKLRKYVGSRGKENKKTMHLEATFTTPALPFCGMRFRAANALLTKH